MGVYGVKLDAFLKEKKRNNFILLKLKAFDITMSIYIS